MRSIGFKRATNAKLANFKMYKSGKQWIFSSMIIIALGLAGATGTTIVSDLLAPQNASAAELPNQNDILLEEQTSRGYFGETYIVKIYGSTDANGYLDVTKSITVSVVVDTTSVKGYPVSLYNTFNSALSTSKTMTLTASGANGVGSITFSATEVASIMKDGGGVSLE